MIFHLNIEKTDCVIRSGLLGRGRRGASDLPRPHNHLQDLVQGCGRSVQNLCILKVSLTIRGLVKLAHFHHLRSEFPLIFSIENHCGLEQQDRMADHLTGILGDLLYTTQPDQEATDLPSPMALRRKILVKAKRLPQDQGAEEEEDDDDDDERDDSQKKAKKQVTYLEIV